MKVTIVFAFKMFNIIFIVLSITTPITLAADVFPPICKNSTNIPEAPIKDITKYAIDAIECLRDQLTERILTIIRTDAPIAGAAYDYAEKNRDGSQLQQQLRQTVTFSMCQIVDATTIQFRRVETLVLTSIHNIKIEAKVTAEQLKIYVALDSLRTLTRTQLNNVFLTNVKFGLKLIDFEDKLAIKVISLINANLLKNIHQERSETEEVIKNMLAKTINTTTDNFNNIINKIASISIIEE